MMPTHPPDRAGLAVRLLIPVKRGDRPEWKVSLHKQVVGWVREKQVGRSSRPFYEAIGIHRPSGQRVSLELSTDREERIELVCEFWLDPMVCKQHLPWQLR